MRVLGGTVSDNQKVDCGNNRRTAVFRQLPKSALPSPRGLIALGGRYPRELCGRHSFHSIRECLSTSSLLNRLTTSIERYSRVCESHDRQQPNGPANTETVRNEGGTPDVILVIGPETNTGAVVQPQMLGLGVFLGQIESPGMPESFTRMWFTHRPFSVSSAVIRIYRTA